MNVPVPQASILNAILTGLEGNPGKGGCGVNFAIGDYEFEFVIDKVTDNQARGTVYLEDWDRLGGNEEVMTVVLEARVTSTTERATYSDDRKADAAYHGPTPAQEDAAMDHYGAIPAAEQKAINARIHAAIDDGR